MAYKRGTKFQFFNNYLEMPTLEILIILPLVLEA
jgi:hypothetical protein